MDGLKTKKKLYAGLGDYSRQLRMKQMGEKYGKKYDTGNPKLDALSASQDEVVEASGLPSGKTDGKGFDLASAVGEVGADAGKWQTEYESALSELGEDEEMEKWTRKQKG